MRQSRNSFRIEYNAFVYTYLEYWR